MSGKIEITREALLKDDIRDWARKYRGVLSVLSPEACRASLAATLARAPPRDNIWVFAYGSLIWNPAFHFVDRKVGRVHGYHREFCLRTHLGRGSPETEGFMLGLKPGGSCKSVAYRIEGQAVETELELVWRREMLTNVYQPRWVRVHTQTGIVPAVTFVMNLNHERYAGDADDEEIVESIATASGRLGRCCDYLFDTVTHLNELGIRDRRMETLAERVRARQASYS